MSLKPTLESGTPELVRFFNRLGEHFFPQMEYKFEITTNPQNFGYNARVMHMPSRYNAAMVIDFDITSQAKHLDDYARHILETLQRKLHYEIAKEAPEHLHRATLWDGEISALFKLLDLQLGTLERPQKAMQALYLVKKGVWAREISTTMLEYDLRMWQHYLAGVADREAAALAERAV